ncbi:MAG TPA: OmpA family protein [Thermoanaerobaculia bacterium]|nr:OmpA family protein [Thermoanaerobaculia bacterium]HUM29372.1 OmpA family protein [Thermoanaerobaculia bacterium]HXK67618.1 OmpA family protein [Thermoanaerobaculia bacterium]
MRIRIALLLIVAVAMVGCATKTYVQQEVSKLNQDVSTRVDGVEKSVEKNQAEIDQLEQKTTILDQKTAQASQTAQDALDRAQDAHRLAQGKLLYEVTLSDDNVHFKSNSSELSLEAMAALEAFAVTLKNENKNVFIEIQGHTDSVGSEEHNYELGLGRAEAVLRYLHIDQGIPLNRMQMISYGEEKPVADNDTPEGRSQNRRVVLVVME